MKQPKTIPRETENEQMKSRQKERPQSNLLVDDASDLSAQGAKESGRAAKKLSSKVFEEPSANSLLDSFGF